MQPVGIVFVGTGASCCIFVRDLNRIDTLARLTSKICQCLSRENIELNRHKVEDRRSGMNTLNAGVDDCFESPLYPQQNVLAGKISMVSISSLSANESIFRKSAPM